MSLRIQGFSTRLLAWAMSAAAPGPSGEPGFPRRAAPPLGGSGNALKGGRELARGHAPRVLARAHWGAQLGPSAPRTSCWGRFGWRARKGVCGQGQPSPLNFLWGSATNSCDSVSPPAARHSGRPRPPSGRGHSLPSAPARPEAAPAAA